MRATKYAKDREELDLVGDKELRHYRENILVKYGYNVSDRKTWAVKWQRLSYNARIEGRESFLTFRQYIKLAAKAGIISPKQIGYMPGNYQMGRVGDKGDYIWGSCRFITTEQNREEKHQNGGTAEMARKKTGQNKHNSAALNRMATHRSRNFALYSPDGKKYTGRNLLEFCKHHGLAHSSIAQVCSGYLKQNRGWTGTYTDDGPFSPL